MPNYISLEDRSDYLNLKYIKNNFTNNNEAIKNLFEDFLNFEEPRQLNKITLFCKYKYDIKPLR